MHKNNYCTIIDAISDLQARGFFLDFSLIGDQLLCTQEKIYLGEEEFVVLEMYRFQTEGPSLDETVVYAIESLCQPLRGILLNSACHTQRQVPPILSRKLRGFWA